jgi:outer membrane receptor protein involved in Fe transport
MDDAFSIHGLELFGIPEDIVNFAIPSISSENYFALSFDYQINDRFLVYGGVHKLTDNDPPLLASNSTQSNTGPSIFDVYGRRYFAGLTARF